LLKQAVREMEAAIRAALADATKVVAHEKILARQLSEQEVAIGRLRRIAETAAESGDDSRAIAVLRQKREREIVASSLAKQLAEVTTAAQALRQQIEDMRRRVDDAQRKLNLLTARQRAAEARQRLLREFSEVPLGDDAFHKFDRMCRKVEQIEAETDALAAWTCEWSSYSLDVTATETIGNEELEAELRELKRRATKEQTAASE